MPFDCLSLLVNLKQKPNSTRSVFIWLPYCCPHHREIRRKANHFFTTTGWQLLPWHSKMALFISLSSHPSKVSTCVIVRKRPHLSPWACLSTFPTCDYDPPSWGTRLFHLVLKSLIYVSLVWNWELCGIFLYLRMSQHILSSTFSEHKELCMVMDVDYISWWSFYNMYKYWIIMVYIWNYYISIPQKINIA